jgi:hypothetical protein
MEILCGLGLVDLVENERIGVVLSRGQVKGFHARLCPYQRQVLSGGLDKLGAALRLNFFASISMMIFSFGILDSSFRLSFTGEIPACSARATCSANPLARLNAGSVMIRVVFMGPLRSGWLKCKSSGIIGSLRIADTSK